MPRMTKISDRYRFLALKDIRCSLHVHSCLKAALMYVRCRATGAKVAKWCLGTNKSEQHVCAPKFEEFLEGFRGFEKALIGQISKDEVCTEVE